MGIDNKNKIHLFTMTMNAGRDDNGPTPLIDELDHYCNYFKSVTVFEGRETEHSKKHYNKIKYDNFKVVSFPWNDDHAARYKRAFESLKDGEWGLWLDSDEIPSKTLLGFMYNSKNFEGECNMYYLPSMWCMQYGEHFYPIEEFPKENERRFTKHILFRKTPSTCFKMVRGSHVILGNGNEEKGKYIPHPYYHTKTFDSFIMSDVWQAFLSPEGQGFNKTEAYQFRLLTKKYKTLDHFMIALREGTWPKALEQFALSKAYESDRPISRLAWAYFIIEGHDPYSVRLSWDKIKEAIIGKDKLYIFFRSIENNNFIF